MAGVAAIVVAAPWFTVVVPVGVVVPWLSFDMVSEYWTAVKFALMVALPLDSVTVVDAALAFVIVAVPAVTVQLEN